MTAAQFRTAFPEFSDIVRYSDAMILRWIAFATIQVNENRWKSQTNFGIQLYVAHEITIEARDIAATNIGGTPGQFTGPVNTKTVGSVTAGYDSANTSEKDAGWWNLTTYGKQFYRLSRTFGAGVVQL